MSDTSAIHGPKYCIACKSAATGCLATYSVPLSCNTPSKSFFQEFQLLSPCVLSLGNRVLAGPRSSMALRAAECRNLCPTLVGWSPSVPTKPRRQHGHTGNSKLPLTTARPLIYSSSASQDAMADRWLTATGLARFSAQYNWFKRPALSLLKNTGRKCRFNKDAGAPCTLS